MKLAIIDTACANLASLKFCLDRLGFKADISRDLKELESADKLFLPGVGVADSKGQIYQFNSSPMLNNNMIIKEITNKYKEQMESALGGWHVR